LLLHHGFELFKGELFLVFLVGFFDDALLEELIVLSLFAIFALWDLIHLDLLESESLIVDHLDLELILFLLSIELEEVDSGNWRQWFLSVDHWLGRVSYLLVRFLPKWSSLLIVVVRLGIVHLLALELLLFLEDSEEVLCSGQLHIESHSLGQADLLVSLQVKHGNSHVIIFDGLVSPIAFHGRNEGDVNKVVAGHAQGLQVDALAVLDEMELDQLDVAVGASLLRNGDDVPLLGFVELVRKLGVSHDLLMGLVDEVVVHWSVVDLPVVLLWVVVVLVH
jgi:hypothetical protein